jgi:hypothetical protein
LVACFAFSARRKIVFLFSLLERFLTALKYLAAMLPWPLTVRAPWFHVAIVENLFIGNRFEHRRRVAVFGLAMGYLSQGRLRTS